MFLVKIKKYWKKTLIWSIFLVFFILPFFWYPKGAMDLGGDGSRLYFYDPLNFLKSTTLYSLLPVGKGGVDATKHSYLIYVLFIALLDFIFRSPSTVINIFNGIKLSFGFLSIYLIIKELIPKNEIGKYSFVREASAILAGIFYITSTGSINLVFFWVKALHSHDQVFLNPLVFWLLLKYFLYQQKKYLFGFLLITFIFSTNFSIISAPPFFAFYPLSIVFLFIYILKVRKVKINFKEIFFAFLGFMGLQAFHLLPSIMESIQPGSMTNNIIFDKAANLSYFDALRGYGVVSTNIFLTGPIFLLRWVAFIPSFTILLSFVFTKVKNKTFFLTGIFFLLTLFLVSANITNIGVSFYRLLFYIPGFSMFRHFFIQWSFVFIFFYSLLFGQSIFMLFNNMKSKYVKVFSVCTGILFIISFWPFLNGRLVDAVQLRSRNVRTAMIMDPRFEKTLSYIRHLPSDGKVLMIPITDNFNQIIFGLNNAAYVGSSSISYIAERESFEGYQVFDDPPYTLSEAIRIFIQAKNYQALTQIFSLLNIRYIYHDTDPKIYEEKFPGFPNNDMMTYLPKTQKEYSAFLQNFPIDKIYKNGPYAIYQFKEKVYRPEVYIPDSIIFDDMIKMSSNSAISYHVAFLDKKICLKNNLTRKFCSRIHGYPNPVITTKKISPVSYAIHVKQKVINVPFLLVFQNSFDRGWKLQINNKSIDEKHHIAVNTYANGWIILPQDYSHKTDYTISIQLETQKYFWYGLIISGFTVLFTVIYFFLSKRRLK